MKSELYSEHENFATENQWTQDRPYVSCHCGKARCKDAKCSFAGRAEWARRQTIVLGYELRMRRKEQQVLYFGTCNFSPQTIPSEASKAITDFQRKLAKRDCQWRWYLEVSPADLPHIHYVLASWERVSEDTIRQLWHDARGEACLRDVNFSPLRSCIKVAEYATGHDQKKFRYPLLKRGLGMKSCGGTQKFFRTTYEEISANYKAFKEFAADENMLDMVQSGVDLQAHYRAIVDAEHEEFLDKAYGRRTLPIEDWSDVFGTPTLPIEDWSDVFGSSAYLQDNSEAHSEAHLGSSAYLQDNSEAHLHDPHRQVHEFATEGLPPRHGGGVPPPYVKGEARRRNTPFETSKGTQKGSSEPMGSNLTPKGVRFS